MSPDKTPGTPPTPSALELENRKLREELKRLNQERIEYLQNVSHQLVAPLNAIKWHIENITNNRVGVDRAKKVLRSVYSQSTLAVHLAKNFALMSNLEADHSLAALREPLQEVDLCALLINLADDFQPLGWDKELNISVDDARLARTPPVLAIKPLISQTFSNILENAVKYSKRGSEIIVSGAHNSADDTVTVTIRSRGVPIKPEEATKIFERGYRSDEAKNHYPAGTGFGLYIAKKIVEIHQGTIRAIPQPLDGVIFEVTLSVSGLAGKGRIRESKDRSSH
jgi:signal transduction histidine kinase